MFVGKYIYLLVYWKYRCFGLMLYVFCVFVFVLFLLCLFCCFVLLFFIHLWASFLLFFAWIFCFFSVFIFPPFLPYLPSKFNVRSFCFVMFWLVLFCYYSTLFTLWTSNRIPSILSRWVRCTTLISRGFVCVFCCKDKCFVKRNNYEVLFMQCATIQVTNYQEQGMNIPVETARVLELLLSFLRRSRTLWEDIPVLFGHENQF